MRTAKVAKREQLYLEKDMFRFVFAGLLMLSGAVAMADGLSYSYIRANYQEVDIDLGGGLDVDGDGFGVAGSAEISDDWFIFANYSTFDFESVVDVSSLTVGAGYHSDVSSKTDWFATLGFAKAEVDVQGLGSEDDSGYAVSLGLRSMVSESFELYGSIGYADLGDGADGTAVAAGFWYTVSGSLALGLGANFDDDVTGFGAGLRLYFD
jgi:hypothetical protein